MSLEIRLLGPPEVIRDGRTADLGGNRQQVVLAALALEADRGVAVGELIEAVWGGAPPATARRQIHTAISVLRRALGPGAIRTGAAGYRLTVTGDRLDLARFEAAVAAGHRLAAERQPRAAAAEFRRGLALWRGPALAGLGGRLEPAAARLDRARLSAWEVCLEQELAAGGGPRTLADLREAHAGHPLHEGITATLMRALFRGGRPGEALAAYRHTAACLADQLGAGPGPLLAGCLTEMLRAAPEHPAVPHQLPARPAGFAGREPSLRRLGATLPYGDRDAVPIVVVSGAGGIGKTALAVHWAHRVRGRFPDGQLYANLHGFDPVTSAASPFDVLRDFLAALGVPVDGIPDSLRGRAGLYRTLMTGRRMLLLLDDARDAEQIRPLLPGSPGSLVVVTSRDRLAGLVVAEDAHPVMLGPLTAGEARELLAGRLGARHLAGDPTATEEIVASCAGLPLALAIVAARLAVNPALSLAAVASELAPARRCLDGFHGDDGTTDLRTVFASSYRVLDGDTARLFRLLGRLHINPDISPAAAAALAGRPAGQVRTLLARLVRVHLLDEHTSGRYSFHALVGAYAAELGQDVDDAADRDAALGRLFDHHLAEDDGVMRATEFVIGRDWQGLRRVLEAHLGTGVDGRELRQVVRAAFGPAGRSAGPAFRAVVCRALAHAATLAGDYNGAGDHLHRALRLFRDLRDPVQEAYCHHNLGIVCRLRDRHADHGGPRPRRAAA